MSIKKLNQYIDLSKEIRSEKSAEMFAQCSQTHIELLKTKKCSFQDIVDAYKSVESSTTQSCLHHLLGNERLFGELLDQHLLTDEEIRRLFDQLKTLLENQAFFNNVSLVVYVLQNKIVTFKEFVDRLKPAYLFQIQDRVFEKLFMNCLIKKEDIKYLLDNMLIFADLYCMVKHGYLISEYILKNFLFDSSTVKRLNSCVKNSGAIALCKISNIFDYMKTDVVFYHRFQDLIELNRHTYAFENLNEEDRRKLVKLLKSDVTHQEKLQYLIESDTGYLYETFEDLKKYLMKSDKKLHLSI